MSATEAPLDIFYESMTGNVRRFVQKVQAVSDVKAYDLRGHVPARPYLLMTYTFGTGEVPAETARFLERHAHLMRAVAVSGSVHWGQRFGQAGDRISVAYNVPLIARINKSGQMKERDQVASWLADQRRLSPPTPSPLQTKGTACNPGSN